jgi:hypothetical protein
VKAVRSAAQQWALIGPITAWLGQVSGGAFLVVLGPLVVVAMAVPVLLIASLLLVSAFMGAAVVRLVAARRFPELQARHGGRWWQSLLWSLGATLLAVTVLVVTLPLWLIPPLALLLPPLIWGWLSYRVMSFDALSEHASADERRTLMARHRWPLLAIGVVTGYFGMAPSLVWATAGALALPFMPLLLPIFVWLYTLVFAFASLWFAHFGLAALAALRDEQGVVLAPLQPAMPPAPPSAPTPAPSSPDISPLDSPP